MRVGVVGGGLAGLVAALELIDAGADTILFEAAARLGGQLRTRLDAGFVAEDGAEGWVNSDPDVPALCAVLGIEREIVQQTERRSLRLSGSKLTVLDPGEAARLLGINASESDLGGGIASLRDGMGSLIQALESRIRAQGDVRLGCEVRTVEPGGRQWRLRDSNGGVAAVDAVILAPSGPTLRVLVEQMAPQAAAPMRGIEFASNVSVSLGFERAAVGHRLDASGFVVNPKESLEGLRACAFSSTKFPGRAAPGKVLLRGFFRPEPAQLIDDDVTWRDRTASLLTPILDLSGAPVASWVARWPDALPQYSSSHESITAAVVAHLATLGRIQLAGTGAFAGGIPGAIRSGRAAARNILK